MWIFHVQYGKIEAVEVKASLAKANKLLADEKFAGTKVKIKSVKAGKKRAKVTWNKVENADGYVVQYESHTQTGRGRNALPGFCMEFQKNSIRTEENSMEKGQSPNYNVSTRKKGKCRQGRKAVCRKGERMSKKKTAKKALALTLSAAMLQSPALVMASNTYITDNTEKVMQNASSEGGGMAYNLSAPTAEELKALKEKYADFYKTPESAGETEYPAEYPRNLLNPMTDEEIEPIVTALIKTMTFEEKLALIADPGWGADKVEKGQAMYLPGVPRLGVPVVRQHDGSAGVEAVYPTTNLPVESVLGNTFDTELASRYGSVIGSELVSIGSNYELGTQFDLVRDMRWARSKDTFGEDYYLTGELATSETKGLQSQGAGAQAKHIGAYATNGDGQLWTFVDEQTLHTAYLYPFEQPVKRADLSEIMTTYTRLNGYYTASNSYLLKDVLRDMWNFKGGVVSDAMSTQEFTTITGMDSEMGKKYNTEPYVLKYMDAGLFTMDDLDAAASHMLWSFGYAGYLGLVKVDEETGLAYADSRRAIKDDGSIQYVMNGTDVSEGGDRAVIELVDSWEDDYADGMYDDNNETAEKVAEEGIVMLKNEDNTLPLTKDTYTNGNKLVLVGWGADNIVSGTGSERSHGFLNYMTTPYEALKEIAGEDGAVESYVLDDTFGISIPTENIYTSEDASENGWNMNDGESVVSDINYLTTYRTNKNSITNLEDGKAFKNGTSNTWTGYLKAPADGDYDLVIQSMGGSATVKISSLDGAIIGEKTESSGGGFPGGPGGGFPGGGSSEPKEPTPVSELSATSNNTALPTDGMSKDGLVGSTLTATLKADTMYKIEVTSRASSDIYDQQVKLSWITPQAEEKTEEAAIAAAKEEGSTVVYFVRVGPTGHGVEITEDDLSMYEDDLETLKKLQAACKESGNKLVVVTYNRTAFAFDGDWADDADAILTAFYPGQSGQQAIANILTGAVNPSGKLSVTLPKTKKETLLYYDPDWDLDGDGEYDEGESYSDYLAWQRFGKGGQNFKGISREYSAQYNEGLNFGYRWYEAENIEPEYAFGHGLSYTTFEYSNIKATDNGDHTYTVTVDVKNTGDVAGDEVVQLYASDDVEIPDSVQMAEKQLVGFARVKDIQPGETKTATMTVSEQMLSYWDSSLELTEREDGTKDKWVLADGTRTLMLGNASDNLPLSVQIEIAPKTADTTGIDHALASIPENLLPYENADVLKGMAEAAETIKTYAEENNLPEEEAQSLINSITNVINELVEELDQNVAENAADLSTLKKAIGKIAVDTEKYEENAAQKIVASVKAAAEAMAAKTNLTDKDQKAIDSLAELLDLTREQLKSKTEVNGGLDGIIDLIMDLNASDYTKASWGKAEAALANAKTVKADANATEQDMNAALTELLAAFGKLEYGVQKTHLESVITAAETILEMAADYDGTESLKEAIESGKAILENTDADQGSTDLTVNAILEQMEKLAKKADLSSLESLVEAAKKLLDGDYTKDSLKNLEDAIKEAESVIADHQREDGTIEKAYEKLIQAILDLEKKGNKAALKAIIAKTEEILAAEDAYIASTIEGLSDTLTAAKTVYDNEQAQQEEIDEAVRTLTLAAAKARLKGDVNHDGVVDTGDSALLLSFAAELTELDADAQISADVNGDGIADTADSVLILQKCVEK